jgi:hypothetical protein
VFSEISCCKSVNLTMKGENVYLYLAIHHQFRVTRSISSVLVYKWSRDNGFVTELLFQRFVALETVSGGLQEHIMSCQCNFGPTEFHFSLEQFEGQGVVLFITKWQDVGTGLSPLGAVPAVVGRRRNNRIAEIKGGYRLAYESPRDKFEGLAPREDLQAVSALSYEERKDLFRKSDSKRARFMRMTDSVC